MDSPLYSVEEHQMFFSRQGSMESTCHCARVMGFLSFFLAVCVCVSLWVVKARNPISSSETSAELCCLQTELCCLQTFLLQGEPSDFVFEDFIFETWIPLNVVSTHRTFLPDYWDPLWPSEVYAFFIPRHLDVVLR